MAGEKGNTFAGWIVNLVFNQVNIPTIATALTGANANPLYLSLHYADPGVAGFQNTSEVTTAQYTSYVRPSVARNSVGFTVSGNAANLAAQINFAAATGGTGVTAGFFGLGTDSTGSGNLIYAGPISPNITIGNGTTPQLLVNTTWTEG